ncbi:MAG: class B sortase [Solibacillus sp.]
MRRWLRIISAAVILLCTVQLIQYVLSYKSVENELTDAKQVVEENTFTTLQQQNANITGWLSLANSRLDNPVMQTDNNEFYLMHNYLDEKSRGGSIFVDYRNEPMKDRHTIFYGHVLRNGTMFGELSKFAEQQYADEHPVFIYETASEKYELQVFAAYETTTDFYYIETQFSDVTFEQFLTEIQQRSEIMMPVDVSVNDRIITFSTCTTSANDKERFVVHAKIVNGT